MLIASIFDEYLKITNPNNQLAKTMKVGLLKKSFASIYQIQTLLTEDYIQEIRSLHNTNDTMNSAVFLEFMVKDIMKPFDESIFLNWKIPITVSKGLIFKSE